MYSDLFLAISCIALSVAVFVLERRISALERRFLTKITSADLKRAYAAHEFAEKVLSSTSAFEEKCKELFSRPFAVDESAE